MGCPAATAGPVIHASSCGRAFWGRTPMTTFTVTTSSGSSTDAYNSGNLATESADGDGLSLLEAIGLAQDGDTIVFDVSLSGDTITDAVSYEISRDITINGDIDGDGTPDITLNADSYGSFFFDIFSSGTTVTLNGLIITGVDGGMAIHAGTNTDLTVSDSIITGNSAIAPGIVSNGADVTLDGVRIEGNTAAGAVVDVRNGTFSITNSSITGNTGDGILLDADTVTAFDGVTVANNTGNGLRVEDMTLTISDSVFSGNGNVELSIRSDAFVTLENSILAGSNTSIDFVGLGQILTFSGTNVLDDLTQLYAGENPTIESDLSEIFGSLSGDGGALTLYTLPSGAQVYVVLVNPDGAASGLGPAFAPTIGGDTADTISEDTATTTGSLTISDLNGAAHEQFNTDTIEGTYGDLEIAANGDWVYTLDTSNTDVDGMNTGDDLTDTITVYSADGTAQDITITIDGANDDATFTGTFNGDVDEGDVGDSAVTASGSVSVIDVDDDPDPTVADVASTAGDNGYGSFVLSSGTWTYTLDESAVQDLDDGDTVTDTITYTASDGVTTQQITVTITGTDDASEVSGTFTGDVDEGDEGDSAVTASGSISITDVDADDSPSFADQGATDGDNGYGSFVLASGTWTYTLDESAVQQLDAGDTVTDTITYTATDSTTQEITVTITGTDDVSEFSGTFNGDVDEGDEGDSPVTATGSISITDADADDSPTISDQGSTLGDNGYGSFVLTSGTWTYTLDQSAVQGLDAGDTVTDTITYTATDSTTQQITVTITGTDDAPVVSGSFSGSLTEGSGTTTVGGSLSISDVDADDSPSFADQASTLGDNAYGSFTLSSGTWTYTLDPNATASLAGGASVVDTITFTATDSTTRQITISISGADSEPTAPQLDSDGVAENDAGAYVGTLSATDPEGGDVTFSTNDSRFEVRGDELWLKAGVSLDYESADSVSVLVYATDDDGYNRGAFVEFDVLDVWASGTLVGSAAAETLDGGEDMIGNHIWAQDGHDTVVGSTGADRMGGANGDDLIYGNAGHDTLFGAVGDDTLSGGNGDDLLYGGAGSDNLDGGGGDDILWTGAGDDMLTGGDGADMFTAGATSGNDVITDFNTDEDTLNLAYRGFADVDAVAAASSDTTQDGESGILIDLGSGESLFLQGLSTDDLAGMNILV
ncbi:MAG: hypothetical protein EP335_12740 [Alphaproteobacteria bacterium]|nr:MAG: hypothetical protein EP335_12740 [Alphaproteobacteria bacterium]